MIINIVNSFVGKKGNIGLRTDKILQNLEEREEENLCICRGAVINRKYTKYTTMGILGHLPRILNFITQIFPDFDNRPLDIKIFERFAIKELNKINISKKSVVHLWEYSPRIIKFFQKRGVTVILDVPIAPATYARDLKNKGLSYFKFRKKHIAHENSSFLLADHIISPSKFVKNLLIKDKIEAAKIKVIEFGSDQVEFNRKWSIKKKINFCFAGIINNRKGIRELLEAWADKNFKGSSLHLCGRITSDVKDLNIHNFSNIILPGFVNTYDYFQACDVFVFPSWMEGSSKSIYEAMSLGMPIITTMNSGSIVRDGIDGIIVEAGNVDELSKAMLFFLKYPNKIKEMGTNAKNRAKKFTWERYSDSVYSVYKNILG